MSTVIKVENLSKQYRLGQVGTGTFSHDLNRWWHRIRGKEDPYLKIGEENDRTKKGSSDLVWALQDINFSVKDGEALGIIGRNGAGKSTLLKILSRTTAPTTGAVKIRGRIASLLEVGTGFHPDLSGRQNVYLNGAILGMTKAEIKSRFDEIVDFAGVERYIDTPVKRYSSGMYVRLAFGVAAHLEPDILIIDEVLAVGDAEFQKKCLGKMKDVSVNEGRTVLFVSHNMLAIKTLCTRVLFLENGRLSATGEMEKVMNKYISQTESSSQPELSSFQLINQTAAYFSIRSITVSNNGNNGRFNIDKDLEIIIHVAGEKQFELINVNLFFYTNERGLIFATCSEAQTFEMGDCIYTCTIPANTLNDNIYLIDIMVVENAETVILNVKDSICIEGVEPKRKGKWQGKFPGVIRPLQFKWIKQEVAYEYIQK